MADLKCKEFTGVTRDKIAKLRDDAARQGVKLPEGDSFTVEKSGVKISVDYSEPSQTVRVCIVDKPMFVPENMVWSIVEAQISTPK